MEYFFHAVRLIHLIVFLVNSLLLMLLVISPFSNNSQSTVINPHIDAFVALITVSFLSSPLSWSNLLTGKLFFISLFKSYKWIMTRSCCAQVQQKLIAYGFVRTCCDGGAIRSWDIVPQ